MLESIIHHGGPYAGLSPVMPAWDKTLTSVEIADVAAYVKSLCDDPDWVPGELSFPRPLITGKAIPEQEVVLGGQFMRAVRNASPNEQSMTFSGAAEYRINGLTEVELEVPVSTINLDPGPSTAGLGDVAVALKRVLFFSVENLTIVSAALELSLPTGRSSKGLGEGQLIWEPNLRAGWKWRQLILQGDLRFELPQQTANSESALLYNVALGYEFEPDPRLELVPMVELNSETLMNGADGGRTLSAVLPQLRLKWLAWSAGAGVQVPFTPVKEFDLRVLFDLTYEYSL
jgi:hypothetical protein